MTSVAGLNPAQLAGSHENKEKTSFEALSELDVRKLRPLSKKEPILGLRDDS